MTYPKALNSSCPKEYQEGYHFCLFVVVSSICRLLLCPLSCNKENVSCHSSRLGFCTWPKQTILRNTHHCLKRSEYINLREIEALKAKKSGSKSGFGHFGTYITWSKMGHVLPMFEALPWFPGDLRLKSWVTAMGPKTLRVLDTATALISFCTTPLSSHSASTMLTFSLLKSFPL